MVINIQANKKNIINWRHNSVLNLASGPITASNTLRVFKPNTDGSWSSYKPDRSINAFTTISSAFNSLSGTDVDENNENRTGTMLLIDALQDYSIENWTLPIAVEDDSAVGDKDPEEFADDVSPWIVNEGNDKVANFALVSGTRITSTQNGNWSDSSTWDLARAPQADDIVWVKHSVSYNSNASTKYKTVSILNGGTLTFPTSSNSQLWTQTLLVRETGSLIIGTTITPVENGITAKIVFTNTSIDTTFDAQQWGNGLFALGTVTMCGFNRGSSFIRVSEELTSTATAIDLTEAATNWQVGDRLIIPDTHQYESGTIYGELEVRTLSSKTNADLTLNVSALTYDHLGPHDDSGILETNMLFHVLNLTRNIIIQSEDVTGVPGHVAITQRASIDIRNVLFLELGRTTSADLNNTVFSGDTVTHVGTNQIGKYPLHLHHLGGRDTQSNGHQFTLIGNVIDGGDNFSHTRKWGITIHGSNFGLIDNNIVFNVFGGGIVLEDGSETENLITNNLVCLIGGPGLREDNDSSTKGLARNGAGFWMRTALNRLRNNVATNCRYGLIINAIIDGLDSLASPLKLPTWKGSYDNNSTVQINGSRIGGREFDGFEVYGAIDGGATFWWLNSVSYYPAWTSPRIVLKNFKLWNILRYGIYCYESAHITLDNWILRGDTSKLNNNGVQLAVHWTDDYRAENFIIKNFDVQGWKLGVLCSPDILGHLLIENSIFKCGIGVRVVTADGEGVHGGDSAAFQRERTITIRNCDLTTTTHTVNLTAIGAADNTKKEIWMYHYLWGGGANLVVPVNVYYYNRGQNEGEDYKIYYVEQASDYVMPQSTSTRYACPEAGLTNTEAYAKYEPWAPAYTGLTIPVKSDNPNPITPGLCICGSIAPESTTTESWTDGLVESI